MPFETGVSTSETDLIQKLLTFLVANGWTSDYSASESDGWRIHCHKGDQFIALRSSTSNTTPYASTYHRNTGHHIHLCAHDSFNSGPGWSAQPGTTYPVICGDIGGPHVGYYFFLSTDCDTLYCAVECTAGVFRFFGFGKTTPFGTSAQTLRWVSAENRKASTTPDDTTVTTLAFDGRNTYSTTAQPGTWLRLNVDASDVWRRFTANTGVSTRLAGSTRLGGFGSPFLAASPSTWNVGLVLAPIMAFALRASSTWSPVGIQKGLARILLTNFSDKQVATIGGKDWMIFPVYQRGSTESTFYGYAIEKEA